MSDETLETMTPNATESSLAREASRRLALYLQAKRKLRLGIVLLDKSDDEPVALPPAVLRLVHSILDQLGKGNAVTLLAAEAELTTQEAADLLRVSRPFLVRLLDEGAIPHRKVGKHRRVLLQHLLEYQRQAAAHQRAALDELAAQAQELNMGY